MVIHMNWTLTNSSLDKDSITSNGNRFLIGNGYLGIRGTLEEYRKEYFPALNLAGIYDQVGDGWREPLNAPNALYTRIEVNGVEYQLPKIEPRYHELSLDYRHGILDRQTVWASNKGTIIVKSSRFASMKEKHLVVLNYSITVDYDCEIIVHTGIDGSVWDIHGPHYDKVEFQKQLLSHNETEILNEKYSLESESKWNGHRISIAAQTHENKDIVYVTEDITCSKEAKIELIESDKECLRKFTFHGRAKEEINFTKYITVFTSKDCFDYKEQSIKIVNHAKNTGYERLLEKHKNVWEQLWNISEVTIEGDDEANDALNYSLYHLHCIAPRHSESLSIAARGLSGQTYKGAVFWDTEMFMLDFFLYTEPEVAKTLLRYRIDTLEGAKKKAKLYGYEGAFYAWESQEGGYDACSDYNVTDVFTKRPMRTYFKDKQVHISSAIVYGIRAYLNYTNDFSILAEGGAETILECAKFYYSLLEKKIGKEYYEIHDVIGPDEYHERVNNNAYTNRMAKLTFETAIDILDHEKNKNEEFYIKLLKQYEIKDLLDKLKDACNKLYIPKPKDNSDLIEQFDGFFDLEDVSLEEVRSRLLHEKEYWGGAYGVASHTQVIKQADVVTMLALFKEEYQREVLQQNLNYYEPRTEHGSSLSACMYSLLYCMCDQPQYAYPFFMKSALADWNGKGKEWAGLVYIGGTHPAAAGGAYMTAIKGFGGFQIENGVIKATPRLPKHWVRLKYRVLYQGAIYEIDASKNQASIRKIEK